MMLKLQLQYFGHLMRRADSLEKTLMLGGIEGRRRGRQRMRWLDGITDLMNVSLSDSGRRWWQGGLACCDSWGRKELDMTERFNWTELKAMMVPCPNRTSSSHTCGMTCVFNQDILIFLLAGLTVSCLCIVQSLMVCARLKEGRKFLYHKEINFVS